MATEKQDVKVREESRPGCLRELPEKEAEWEIEIVKRIGSSMIKKKDMLQLMGPLPNLLQLCSQRQEAEISFKDLRTFVKIGQLMV